MTTLDIIKLNLAVFKDLKPHQKLMVDTDYRITVDGRWFQGIRRYGDGSSRALLLPAIRVTYDFTDYQDYLEENRKYVYACLTNMYAVLYQTYKDYDQLHKIILEYKRKYALDDSMKSLESEKDLNVSESHKSKKSKKENPSTTTTDDSAHVKIDMGESDVSDDVDYVNCTEFMGKKTCFSSCLPCCCGYGYGKAEK